VRIGDHVSLNWAANCGNCFYCNRSQPFLCAAYATPNWAGTMPDGSTRLSSNGLPIYHFKIDGMLRGVCRRPGSLLHSGS
ncbi:MAG: alcohol dehydrogenase catalytic domain-containing protein, partial [bacterium]